MNYKLISSILIASISSVVCTVSGDLLITGVYDGPLSGGTPKGVELYVVNDIADTHGTTKQQQQPLLTPSQRR